MKTLQLPRESGMLRLPFAASILTHAALVVAIPLLWAGKIEEPAGDEPTEITFGDPPDEPSDPLPAPAADPTPPPDETVPPDAMSDATPPPPTPVATPPPEPAKRPPQPTVPRRTSPAQGTPGPRTATAGSPAGRPGISAPGPGIQSPKPAYPFQARRLRLVGTGVVTAWTDPTGRVIRCEVRGLPELLAEHTRQFALANWRGPALAQFTREIEYRLE